MDPSLDGRSKTGHWMGFYTATKDGHRVYWSERTVAVERSVKFIFEGEINTQILPLEEENSNMKQ